MRTCGAGLQHGPRELGRSLDDVLAVVEDEQRALRLQVRGQRLQQRAVRLGAHAEQLRRLADDERRVADRRQVDEPDAVGERGQLRGGDLEREPCLAEAAHAEQRHQAGRAEMRLHLALLALAADEGSRLVRQVVRDLVHGQPPVARPDDAVRLLAAERRQRAPAAGGLELVERLRQLADLEELDRVADALELPVAVRDERVRAGFEALAGRCREQRLAAASDRHDARGDRLGNAFDLERLGAAGDVVGGVLAQDRRADMQADAGGDARRQRRQSAMVGKREGDGVAGALEEDQHAVGLVDLPALAGGEEVACEPVVGGPDLGHGAVAVLLGEPGAVDDVGQQEGLDNSHVARRGAP
jgi:hypothetical protein